MELALEPAPGNSDIAAVAERAAAGDEEAFAVIVRRFSRPLWSFAYGMLSNPEDAEDVVQETFLKGYRSMGRWRREASLKTYLTRIARNLCIDRLRARKPVEPLPETEPEGQAEEDPVTRVALRSAVSRLGRKEREAFVLVDVVGMTGEEAAKVLKVPATTLRSRLYRAHETLMKELR